MINVDCWNKFPTFCSKYQRSWLDRTCNQTAVHVYSDVGFCLHPHAKNRKYLQKVLKNFDLVEKVIVWHDVINITITKHHTGYETPHYCWNFFRNGSPVTKCWYNLLCTWRCWWHPYWIKNAPNSFCSRHRRPNFKFKTKIQIPNQRIQTFPLGSNLGNAFFGNCYE